jgi:ribonuclease HII
VPCRAFADSKTLTEEKRDALMADIRADPMMGTVVDSLIAAEISAKMLQRRGTALAHAVCSCALLMGRQQCLSKVRVEGFGEVKHPACLPMRPHESTLHHHGHRCSLLGSSWCSS